ncbi:MAG: hypothetical protein RBU27_02220 [Bacteroidota bacterium]|jgi:hypothetical protein|nr:hypothetical protein [Bacteroidota bacterium]
MERFFRYSLSLFGFVFAAALLSFGGCSDDDGTPTNPDPTDTNTVTIDDKVRTIVFVHGTHEAADVFTQLIQRFALNGYTEAQLVAFDLQEYFTGTDSDVAKMAAQLQTKVNAVLTGSADTRVDIIAHGSGASAVQHWLVNMGGTAKAAHVIFAGGTFDLGLTIAGDITPGPCKYLSIRSDGTDAAQHGNAEYGKLAGATDAVFAGHDNLELLSAEGPFEAMHTFLTGTSPAEKNMPNSRIGMTYEIKARLIDFLDNTPVAGVTVVPVKIRTLANGEIQRQASSTVLTSDANGEISYSDVVGPEQHLELWVRSGSQSHFDMHVYRQPWRANSHTERLRMIPRSPAGSDLLRAYSAALRTGNHAVMLVISQNRTMISGRDELTLKRYNPAYEPIGEASVLTPGNAPVPGGSAPNGNTWFLSLLDYDTNTTDGTGPIAAPGLNLWGMNSFDCYFDVTTTNYQTQLTLNGRTLGVFNYRSGAPSGSSISGLNIIQFEY